MTEEEIITDMELAHRIKRTTDYILDKVKKYGEMTYYDEDVMFIINYFLCNSSKNLIATELVAKQQQYFIHKEEIRHLERHIGALKEEIERQKEINKEHQEENGKLRQEIKELTEKVEKYRSDWE